MCGSDFDLRMSFCSVDISTADRVESCEENIKTSKLWKTGLWKTDLTDSIGLIGFPRFWTNRTIPYIALITL